MKFGKCYLGVVVVVVWFVVGCKERKSEVHYFRNASPEEEQTLVLKHKYFIPRDSYFDIVDGQTIYAFRIDKRLNTNDTVAYTKAQLMFSKNAGKTWKTIKEIYTSYNAQFGGFFVLHRDQSGIVIFDGKVFEWNNQQNFTISKKIPNLDPERLLYTYFDFNDNKLYISFFNSDDRVEICAYDVSTKLFSKLSPNLINHDPILINKYLDYLYVVTDTGYCYKLYGNNKLEIDSINISKFTGANGVYIEESWAHGNYVFISHVQNGKNLYPNLFSNDRGKTWHQLDTLSSSTQYTLFDDSILVKEVGNSKYFRKINDTHWNNLSNYAVKYIIKNPTRQGRGNDTMYTFNLIPSYYFSTPTKWELTEKNDSIKLKITIKKGKLFNSNIAFALKGAETFYYEQRKNLSTNFYPTSTDSTEWAMAFHKNLINAKSGTEYKLELIYTDNNKEYNFTLGPYTYNPVSVFEENKTLTIILSIILGYFLFLSILLITSPYTLYKLYTQFNFVKYLQEITGKFGIVFKLLDELTFFPLFIRNRRVLDAWINKHWNNIAGNSNNNSTANEENINATTKTSKTRYVPLPISIGTPDGNIIEKPDAAQIADFFQTKRVVIQIIGPGGVGKTTLAKQIGEWASNITYQKYFRHLYLPIMIEEETDDLVGTIERKIIGWTQEKPEPKFLETLLAKKRLLIIIDALSERSQQMQNYIASIHGRLPVNALIITTRANLDMQIRDVQRIYPRSLEAENLLFFMSSILVDNKIPVLKPLDNQLAFAKKVAQMFVLDKKEIPIVPVLLKLTIDKVLEIAKANPGITDINTILAMLPGSIPEVFFDYLLRVNPRKNNPISDEEIQASSEFIASLSLQDDFIPKDINVTRITEELRNRNLLTEQKNPLQRLILNGIVTAPKTYANNSWVRFALDPLAEYLAAMDIAKKCGKSDESWRKIYAQLHKTGKPAAGFLQALKIVQYTYASLLGWSTKTS